MTKYKPYICDESRWLQTFGDVDFINYGGQLLVRGVSEGDPPYLEVVVEPTADEAEGGDWKPEARWSIYRVEPELHKSLKDEWFYSSLASVAETHGTTAQAIAESLSSANAAERAYGYILLAEHHGWQNFDEYPLTLNQHEVHARYGMEADCGCTSCQ